MFKKSILISTVLVISLLVGPTVLAVDTITNQTSTLLNNVAGEQGAGYLTTKAQSNDYATAMLLGQYINYLLSLLGIIFLVVIIYAGILWMMAGGNEEQVTKAKGLLRNGVIGIAIVLAAGIISLFTFSVLLPIGYQ